jgi:hypothetical protein
MPASTLGKKLTIPEVMLEKFRTEMRIIRPGELVGLWPIDPGMLKDEQFITKLLRDKAFTENYHIAIVAKA